MDEEELIVDEMNDQSQTQPLKEAEKKPEPAKPETPAVEKPKEDTKKPEDAKKTEEELAKKKKEDEDKKKADDLLAQQKAAADLAAKKAEEKRQDDLNKHLTQPLFMLTQAGVRLMKDNPDLGKNGKVIYIPGLYYESVEVLLNEVCRIVMAQCVIENVTARHNAVTGQVKFEWNKGTLKFISFDKYFFNQMGMITQHVEMSSKPLFMSHSGVTGNRRAWLEDVQTLYIYSDVIDYQIVGNSKAMLMGVFPVKGKHGEQQSWQFNPFQYIDIPSSNISSITMRICTPTGEDVPFMSGDTLCRLHFRRKML